MIYPINHLPDVISVGVQTEQGVEVIGFDLKPWLDVFPEMTFTVWPSRPGESEAYPAKDQMMIGTVLYWHPDGYDTEIAGQGLVEIAGVCEDLRKASGFVQTSIRATSLAKTKDPGENVAPWYEAILKAAEDVSADLDAVKAEIPGILLVRIGAGNVSSHTQQEVKDAYYKGKTGKAVQAVDSMGRVYTMTGVENGVPTFTSVYAKKALGGNRNPDALIAYTARLLSDNTFSVGSPNYSVTPNPYALKLTGAVEATYDGSSAVTVEIPQGGGIADPGIAHQMLVSDAAGKAVWQDAFAYKIQGNGTLLAATTLAAGDERNLTSPWRHAPLPGTVCTVTYNGTAYECLGVDASALIGAVAGSAVAFGKLSDIGLEGGNASAPFVLLSYAGYSAAHAQGVYGMLITDNTTDNITISVSGPYETVKQIDDAYIPSSDFVVSVPITKDGSAVTFGTADKTWEELEAAHNAGKTIRVQGISELGATFYGDVKCHFRGVDGLVLVLEMYTDWYLNAANRVVRGMTKGENGQVVFSVMD